MASRGESTADRIDAASSNGSRSEQRGGASRLDSLKAGLNAPGVARAEQEGACFDDRLERYRTVFRPANIHEEWLVEEVALMSLRIRRCQRHEWALRMRVSERAEKCWKEDRGL